MAVNPDLTGETTLNAAPADKTDKARWIADFIDDLRRLRQDAGQPSLRKMSETAHYSHTALSGVLSGGRLPSLDLTLAFVRACGGDEDQWRERWQQANARINPVPTVVPQPSVRRRWSRRRSVPGAVLVGLSVLVTGGLILKGLIHQPAARPQITERPVTPGNPTVSLVPSSASLPLIPGDDSDFVGDVTFPDGSPVHVNERFTKIWEIRNAGSVPWQDRYLVRQTPQDQDLCSSPQRVPVPLTQPHHNVQISVPLTAPSLPGSCRIDWKMTDANGTKFFPNESKGLYMTVNVIP
jgi:hypothetical protein